MKAAPPLLTALRARFVAAADPARAAQQAAYMKSAMPFHGLVNAQVKAICREMFAPLSFDDPASWRAEVLGLWRRAAFREERYAALHLAADLRARPLSGLPRTAKAPPPPDAEARAREALALYRELIVTGAWWDLVDEVATHRLPPLLEAHRSWMDPVFRAWAHDDDLWIRRASIIGQMGLKRRLDHDLLRACIEPSLGDHALGKTFWLRKAIGWALREDGKVHPDWVRAYVVELGSRLAPLSRREALKHLGSSDTR